ncbi:chromosome segregation protein SMC [Methylothermus subterraneus]
MRLEKIKLAGFKSFVEPTTVVFPERLIGIVGPNGCGKSNLIDAVRFVIGETSAKHLRGSAMPDVIFNGSETRKPAAFASVELVFDNREGRCAEEYAKFPQIALRRELSRDGQSQYFINGTRCRRRDVLDVLLGTGLGPRSYAIIEQGMITHLIEAKPEELRLFIEEAAGLSKYKERRHETELKLEHVRANLQRAEDIRGELKQQVDRLAKQAKTAEKYRGLSQAIAHCHQELIALKWREAERDYRRQQAKVREQEQALAETQAALDQAGQSLAQTRAETERLGRQLQEQQGQLYELNAALGQCEQSLRHAQKTLEERERSLEAWRAELARSEQHCAEIQAQLDGLEEEQERLAREQSQALAQLEESQARLQAAERRWREAQERFDREREAHGQEAAQLELLKTEIRHLEQQLAQSHARQAQLSQEREQLAHALAALDRASLAHQAAQAKALRERKLKEVAAAAEVLRACIEQKQASERQLKELEAEFNRLQGQLAGLQSLQSHALGKDRALEAWLEAHGLKAAPRLGESLEVEAGWETAVESALAEWLEAVVASDLQSFAQALAELKENLALIELRPNTGPIQGDALAAKLKTPWDLSPWLAGYRCIESLEQALARRRELAGHERWITPSGDQVGPAWVKLQGFRKAHPGILERQKALKELRARLETLTQTRSQWQDRLNRLSAQLAEAEQRLKTLEREERDSYALSERCAAELHAAQLRQAEMRQRLERLNRELESASQQRQTLETKLTEREQKLAQQTKRHTAQTEALAQRRSECDRARAELDQIAAQTLSHRDLNAKLRAALERLAHTRQLLAQQLQRAQSQKRQLRERLERTQAEQVEGKAPIEQRRRELQTLLARRAVLEKELAATRTALKRAEAAQQDQAGRRRRLEQARDEARRALEEARLAAEAARVRGQTVLAEAEGLDLPKLLGSLPETATIQSWQSRLEELKAQQARLGDVNLAAIEEHRQHAERLRFLDKQCQDLSASLEMLTKAIRQIDRECRALFRATFETIDRHFRQRFPALFGGGEAWLELIGPEDPLEAGVRVVARPPGKRNQSVHLLSGGEKALTAIALIFSFFELNPAPVCLLDEVDAPLDEANVGRFGELLKSMAERVQFVFVTHNKTTMEIAERLIGVTMREPGVSRVITVDLKQAAEMAA